MGSVTLRPASTIWSGDPNGAIDIAAKLNDASTLTTCYGAYAGTTWYGNKVSLASNFPTVSFANATGTVPAGRQIISVQFNSQVRTSSTSNNSEAGCTSYKYGGANAYVEALRQNGATDGGLNLSTLTNTLSTMSRQDGGTDRGLWTYEDVDEIVCVLGSTSTGKSLPGILVDLWLVVTYSDIPGTPTSVTPANAATVTVPNPTLGGTMAAIASGQTQKMEWQFATDTGFTANVKTVTEGSGDLRASGATTESPTIANLSLSNGTWYMRARAVDQYGIAGSWSSTNTITVNTPVLPTPTVVTPANASTVTTMTPTLGLTLGSDGAGRQQKAEWQLATDSGFTSNVHSVVELDADFRASGATTEVVSSGNKITYAEGTTWYLRGRSVGNDGTTSAWTANQTFTLSMAAPPTPTAVTPASGSTVTSSQPTLGATLGAASESRAVKARWQLASDSGFTTNLKTVTELDADLRTSGATTEETPLGSKLSQGTWYIRAAEVDQYGQIGSYSTGTSFTVSHPPTAAVQSPGSDTVYTYATNTTFSWTFSDAYSGDTQTAVQIIVERNDTGAVVYDSNKVTQTAATLNIASASLLKDVKLRWKVRVWDADNVAGAYSPYSLFTLSDLPVVTITAPTGVNVATGNPTVTWTLDGATTQVKRQIVFRKNSDNSIVHDSGLQTSALQSYTPSTTILENATVYNIIVSVTDQNNMVGSDNEQITTNYPAPATCTFTTSAISYDTAGYVRINWSSTTADSQFISWQVYRRMVGEIVWTLLYTTNDVSVVQYDDYLASAGNQWEYTVTQSAARSGYVLDSAQVASASVSTVGTHYWIIDPSFPTNSMQISNVTADSYVDEFQQEVLQIIGRGRKVNQGTRFGYNGTLDAQFRDDLNFTARQKREMLQALKAQGTTFYLRNPFGDIISIAMGNISISRVSGVGTSEFVDVQIPYMEVM